MSSVPLNESDLKYHCLWESNWCNPKSQDDRCFHTVIDKQSRYLPTPFRSTTNGAGASGKSFVNALPYLPKDHRFEQNGGSFCVRSVGKTVKSRVI